MQRTPKVSNFSRLLQTRQLAQTIADCIESGPVQPVPVDILMPALALAYDLVMQRRLDAARRLQRERDQPADPSN